MLNIFKKVFRTQEKVEASVKDDKSPVMGDSSFETPVSDYQYDYMVIDFETANNFLSSVCSVGIVAVKDMKFADTYYSLVNPEAPFNDNNIRIHGITEKDVVNAPNFVSVFDDIISFIDKSNYVIAHNAQFDMSVLYYASKKYDLSVDNFKYIDSISFTKPQTPGSGNSLEAKLEYFGFTNENAHNALDDSIATNKIIIASINKSRFKNIHTYLKGYYKINVNNFDDLNPSNEIFRSRNDFERIKISELEVSHDNDFDKDHYFYGKSVVLTGNFESFSKRQIMQKIVDHGGIVKTSVSRKTHVLVVGVQELSIVGEDGLSTKQEKAYELIEKGIPIEIIDEKELKRIFD